MKTRVVSPRHELSYPSPPSSLWRFLLVALMSGLCFLQHCWVCAAAGRARQEALAPVEELVPTPIPLHPSPTPHTAGQHRWSPQQSGPVANLSEAEKKEAHFRGCGFQLSEFWPEGTQQRFVFFLCASGICLFIIVLFASRDCWGLPSNYVLPALFLQVLLVKSVRHKYVWLLGNPLSCTSLC